MKKKMYWLAGLIIFLTVVTAAACTGEDAALSKAKEELPFPVLEPQDAPEGWTLDETIYEDRLLVTVFINENNGRIDLVQDQNIQGLNLEELRDFLLADEPLNFTLNFNSGRDMLEVSDYVGELAYLMGPEPTIQYTFVQKADLFAEIDGDVPYYQLIGKNISTGEMKEFIYSLEAAV